MRKSALEEGERWLAQAAVDSHWAEHLAQEGGWHNVYTEDAARDAVALAGEAVAWVRQLLDQAK